MAWADEQGDQWQAALAPSTMLLSIIPLRAAFAGATEPRKKAELKPCRSLWPRASPLCGQNGLTKCTWNFEYVDMVEFLPAPRSLRIMHRAREANYIPTGQFGGGSWPIPSTTAAPKQSASRAGRQHVDEMFYAIRGDDGKK